MIDRDSLTLKCRQMLELLDPLDEDSTKEDVKQVAKKIFESTNWFYEDHVLLQYLEYLRDCPHGDKKIMPTYNRTIMFNVIGHTRYHLHGIIQDLKIGFKEIDQ